MENRTMPNLKKMSENGAWGELETIFPPVTAPAWTSFVTGKNPGKHGIFEFLSKQDIPVNRKHIKSKPIWNILSNKKSIILNIPVTYPPEKINRIMITGFLTPENKNFSYPPEISKEIEERFGKYPLFIKTGYKQGKIDKFLKELKHELNYKIKVAKYLMEKYSWDFSMLHILGTDRIQHELWHLIDKKNPMYKKEEAIHKEKFYNYFKYLDKKIGELKKALGNTTFMIVSDHGFGPTHYYMDINLWLLKNGFIKLKKTPLSLLKFALFKAGFTPESVYILGILFGKEYKRGEKDFDERLKNIKLAEKIFFSFNDIDWKKTKAYSKGNYGQIFVNLKHREENGSVEKKDYRKIVNKIKKQLQNLKHKNQPVIEKIFEGSDIYNGPFMENAPDICFLPRNMKYKVVGTLAFLSNKIIRKSYSLSGDHRMNGIFFITGKNIVKTKLKLNILDIAPTILYIFKEKIPKDMDGKVIKKIFSTKRKIKFSEISYKNKKKYYTEKNTKEIKERLRKLGYF
jgi:predicted AlkP superfamily phosphohydrolase/phosphomutase